MDTTRAAEPVRLTFDAPEKVANWRPLVHWLLGIPHYIIAYALNAVAQVIWLISFFAVLFTENIPEGLFRFQVMARRYQARAFSYALFTRESYPPFDFTMSETDPGNDALGLSIDRPAKVNRWLPLVKWLLAVPHYIMLVIYGVGVIVVAIITFFAVLFTGRYPSGMRDYVVKVFRYAERVSAYIMFMRDEYPKFSLS
jgi:hypothetical protein